MSLISFSTILLSDRKMLPLHLLCRGGQEHKVQGKEAFQHKIASSLENQRLLCYFGEVLQFWMRIVNKHNLRILCESSAELPKGCVISLLQTSRINSDNGSDPWIHNPHVQGAGFSPSERNLSGTDVFASARRPLAGEQGWGTVQQLKNWCSTLILCLPLLLLLIFRLRGKNETLTHNLGFFGIMVRK